MTRVMTRSGHPWPSLVSGGSRHDSLRAVRGPRSCPAARFARGAGFFLTSPCLGAAILAARRHRAGDLRHDSLPGRPWPSLVSGGSLHDSLGPSVALARVRRLASLAAPGSSSPPRLGGRPSWPLAGTVLAARFMSRSGHLWPSLRSRRRVLPYLRVWGAAILAARRHRAGDSRHDSLGPSVALARVRRLASLAAPASDMTPAGKSGHPGRAGIGSRHDSLHDSLRAVRGPSLVPGGPRSCPAAGIQPAFCGRKRPSWPGWASC